LPFKKSPVLSGFRTMARYNPTDLMWLPGMEAGA